MVQLSPMSWMLLLMFFLSVLMLLKSKVFFLKAMISSLPNNILGVVSPIKW